MFIIFTSWWHHSSYQTSAFDIQLHVCDCAFEMKKVNCDIYSAAKSSESFHFVSLYSTFVSIHYDKVSAVELLISTTIFHTICGTRNVISWNIKLKCCFMWHISMWISSPKLCCVVNTHVTSLWLTDCPNAVRAFIRMLVCARDCSMCCWFVK